MSAQIGQVLFADAVSCGLKMMDATTPKFKPTSRADETAIHEQLGESVIVDYTNVCEYFLRTGADRWPIEQLTGLRLPHPCMWLETSNAPWPKVENSPTIARTGILATEVADADVNELRDLDLGWLHDDLPPTVVVHQYHIYQWYKEGIKEIQVEGVFPGEGFLLDLGVCGLVMDKRGRPLTHVNAMWPQRYDCEFHVLEDWLNGVRDIMGAELFPSLLAVQFMNCRGVKMVEEAPVPKLSKAREKKTGKPLLRFHTIQLEPVRKILQTEGNINVNGLKKALHLCLGSFATYTEKKPLFGHYVGQVWRPSSVKGSVGEGIVSSNYTFKPVPK